MLLYKTIHLSMDFHPQGTKVDLLITSNLGLYQADKTTVYNFSICNLNLSSLLPLCPFLPLPFFWLPTSSWREPWTIVNTWGAVQHRPQTGFSSRLFKPLRLYCMRQTVISLSLLLTRSGLLWGMQGVGLWEGMKMDTRWKSITPPEFCLRVGCYSMCKAGQINI